MRYGRYVIAACLLLLPPLAQAQDFGVMESAETIDKGTLKLKVNPMFLMGSGDHTTGIDAGLGYGFTDRFDIEGNVARYKNVTFLGANAEYWLVKGQKPLDVSAIAGFHFAKSDFGDQTGVDLTLLASHAATPKLDIYGGLDLSLNKYRESFPDNSYTEAHLVPGVEYKIHKDLDLLAEFGLKLNDHAVNYASIGFAYYFR